MPDLDTLIERVGSNTHTAYLLQNGQYADALTYIRRHELDDKKSYPYQYAAQRLVAYQELVELLEGMIHGR